MRSIDEIFAQPLEVTNFANDGSATLPIQTNIPVACTIVYGTTPQFGSVSLDQDMDGGTHSNHNPYGSLRPQIGRRLWPGRELTAVNAIGIQLPMLDQGVEAHLVGLRTNPFRFTVILNDKDRFSRLLERQEVIALPVAEA